MKKVRPRTDVRGRKFYISKSNVWNVAVSKNSGSEIFNPSHSIFNVTIPGFILFPYKMFLIVEGGTDDSNDNLWIDIRLSSSKNINLFRTAE